MVGCELFGNSEQLQKVLEKDCFSIERGFKCRVRRARVDEEELLEEYPEYGEELKKLKDEALILRSKIRAVFSTNDGKDVADYLLYEVCGIGRSVFDENAAKMARKAGAQEVGLFLKAILDSKDEE